jgi:hypothetical protein
MERRLPLLLALLLGAALAAPTAYAQDKTKAKAKEDRVTGTVQLVKKDTMTILVTGEAGNTQQQVVYDAATKVTSNNKKPASIDDVQTGRRVICLGKLNDKGQLMARHIDLRPAS